MTDASRARRIIEREYGDSINFMTPTVLRREIVTDLPDGHTVAVELSIGEGLERETIYGASFVVERPDGTTSRLTDTSGVFFSKAKAEAYIEHVREHLEGAETLTERDLEQAGAL